MKLDNCEICHGEQGGVPGNENRIDGKIVCDYCSINLMKKLAKDRRDKCPEQ